MKRFVFIFTLAPSLCLAAAPSSVNGAAPVAVPTKGVSNEIPPLPAHPFPPPSPIQTGAAGAAFSGPSALCNIPPKEAQAFQTLLNRVGTPQGIAMGEVPQVYSLMSQLQACADAPQ